MSITNPDYGLQLTDDTIVLYKSIAEVGNAQPADGQTFSDSSGNGYFFGSAGDTGAGPHPVNGPTGRDGALNDGLFAVAFRYNLPNAGGRPDNNDLRFEALGTTPQYLNDAHRVAFTQQIMFYYDPVDSSDGHLIGTASGSSTLTSGDYLGRVWIDQGTHTIHVQFESANVITTFVSTTAVCTPGRWHVVTVEWTPGTGYAIDVHLHELNAGVVTGGQKTSTGDIGTLPLAASGLAAPYLIGNSGGATQTMLHGAIAFVRFHQGGMTALEAADQAEELLLTGELASIATTSDLFRIEFNERPGFVDEGPLGLHSWLKNGSLDTTAGGTNDRHIDLVGTGGRTRSNSHSLVYTDNHVPNTSKPTEMNAQFPGYDKLENFFNDTVATIPEYTIQQIGWWGASPDSERILRFYAISSTGFYRGPLMSVTLDLSDGSVTWLSYDGGSSAAVISNEVSAGPIPDSVRYQTMLITLRCGENPGSPGVMRYRISINDDLDVISGDLSNIPGDGRWGALMHGFPTEGLYQEMKLTFGEISDQDILDDHARIASREGAGSNAVIPVDPSPTQKSQFVSAEDLDILLSPFMLADGTVVPGTDTLTIVAKAPDTTIINPTATYDVSAGRWVASIPAASFQEGEWLIYATSDAAGTFPQFSSLWWGDYVDDIPETRQAAVGRWRIEGTTLNLYEEDGVTIFQSYELKDSDGNPSSARIYDKDPI